MAGAEPGAQPDCPKAPLRSAVGCPPRVPGRVLFILMCADIIYVFPRVNFEFFVKTASLGGQKQVPNFTLYADANQFEPAGHSDTRFDISGFRNAFFLVPRAK
jgi:hypothetical protein